MITFNSHKKQRKKTNIIYFFLIFILQIGGLSFIRISQASNVDNEKINVDYLDQLPKGNYILGTGDVINIKISRKISSLDSSNFIDESGTITLPRLKRIYVSGLTIDELVLLLNKKYQEFVIDPDVEIRITKYRPVRIYIDGEIENPGMYLVSGTISPRSNVSRQLKGSDTSKKDFKNFDTRQLNIDKSFSNNLKTNNENLDEYFPTLFDAIRIAGGITFFSDLSNIKLVRKNNLSNGGGLKETQINFGKVITEGDISKNIRIYDEDVITIKKTNKPFSEQLQKAVKTNLNPRFIQVSIYGRVESPGIITITKSTSLKDSIQLAGGVKALRGKISFKRFNQDGTIDSRIFPYSQTSRKPGSRTNPILKNGDIIFVGKSGINVANEILSEVTAPFLGIYSGIKLFD